jgi:hypothetical protein
MSKQSTDLNTYPAAGLDDSTSGFLDRQPDEGEVVLEKLCAKESTLIKACKVVARQQGINLCLPLTSVKLGLHEQVLEEVCVASGGTIPQDQAT